MIREAHTNLVELKDMELCAEAGEGFLCGPTVGAV